MTLQERAEQLIPYQFPSNKESDLIEQYGTAADLNEWRQLMAKCEKLIAQSETIPESDLVRLAGIRARAEHRFFEDTLHGDYELFKELVLLTVNGYSPEKQAYQVPELQNQPDYMQFSVSLLLHCLILVNAERHFGWDKLTDENGRKFTHSVMFDRITELFPDAQDAIKRSAEQLAVIDSQYEAAAAILKNTQPDDDQSKQPPAKKKKRKQIHIDALPAHTLFPLDNVNYWTFEGMLEAADYGGQLQSVLMYTKSYKLQDGRRKAGKPVNVLAIMECKDADFSQPLDLIDGAILRAVYTLLDAGENRFTLSHVWNMIAGADQRTNKSRIDDMCSRVRRMIATTAKINYREYAEDNNIEYTDDITAQILPGVKLRERKNAKGETVEAELFCQLPLDSFPLYQFAQHTGQIDRLTIEEATVRGLDVNGKAQALTDYRLIIREVLLRRITKRHSSQHDQVIRLTALRKDDLGLYDRVNAESPAQQLRARETAENFLCEWIQLGTLYAYAWRKTGKTFDAILIATTADEMKNFPGADWVRPAAADS